MVWREVVLILEIRIKLVHKYNKPIATSHAVDKRMSNGLTGLAHILSLHSDGNHLFLELSHCGLVVEVDRSIISSI